MRWCSAKSSAGSGSSGGWSEPDRRRLQGREKPPKVSAAWAHHDRRLEAPEPVAGEGHEVARLEPPTERRVLDLEQAAGAERAAAKDVARTDVDIRRGAFEHFAERVVRARPRPPRDFDEPPIRTSDRGRQLEVGRLGAVARSVGELIRRQDPRPDRE